MNRVAQDVIASIRELADPSSAKENDILAALLRAEENGSHQILPSLLPFIFPKEENRLHRLLRRRKNGADERIQAAAIGCADRILRRTSVTHLPQIDAQIRSTYASYLPRPMGGWFEAHVSKVDSMDCSAGERASVLGLLLCHPSGFVREHALETLAEHDLAAALPWAIVRANDWVAKIRTTAVTVLRTAIVRGDYEAIALGAPLIERFRSWGRSDHSEVEQALVGVFFGQGGLKTLREQLGTNRDARVRRSLARFASRLHDNDFAEFAELLVRDRDPGVRGVVAHNLSRFGASARSFEEVLYDDRIATFNLLALESELRRDPEYAAARLPELVFHRSSAIRYLARDRLTEREKLVDGRSHFAELYRSEALSGSKRSIAALGGLAEVGEKSDVAILAPLLTDPRSKLVRATLKNIYKLDPIQASEHLKAALGDSRPGVRHDALRLLRAGLSDADAEQVLSIAKGELASVDPKYVLNLTLRLPYWAGVETSLRIAAHAEGELAVLAREYLVEVSRHGQGQLPPKGETAKRLPDALMGAQGALSDALVRQLQELELPFGGGRPFRSVPSVL